MTREQKISEALRRLLRSVEALGKIDSAEKRTYFEMDVTKSGEALARWRELHDARMEAMSALAD